MGTHVPRTVPSRLAPTAKSRLVGMEGETLKGPVNDKVIIAKPLRPVANLQQTTYYTGVTRGVWGVLDHEQAHYKSHCL